MANQKVENIQNKNREIRVKGVGNLLHTEIKYISQHIGCDMASWCKNALFKAVQEVPPHYKKPLKDD